MRKFSSAIAAMALIGSALVSTSAAAQVGTYTGYADVFKGIPLNCAVSIQIISFTQTSSGLNPVSGHGTANLNITSPEPNCDLLSVTSNSHTFNVDSGAITINNVRAETITIGNCYGNMVGELVNLGSGNWEMVFDTIIKEEIGGGDCYVSGVVTKI